jgi:sec-independent protein translocase protein TatC
VSQPTNPAGAREEEAGSAPRPGGDAAAPKPPGRAADEARLETELARLDEEIDEVEAHRMPLMAHLIELRDRMIKAALALMVGMGIGFWKALDVYDLLTAPFVAALSQVEGVEGSLSLVHSPFEGVTTWFKVSFITGILVASPVISYQAWAFVAPGLYKSERRLVLPLSLASVVLFAMGSAFCFYAIFPYAFPFFIEVLGVDVNLSADGYLSAVIRMMLAFGACFQLPVVSIFLARAGLVDGKDLAGAFRYAVVVIFTLAAIITPPDPMTQVMLAVPMCILYGISIGLAALFTTKVREPAGAAAA